MLRHVPIAALLVLLAACEREEAPPRVVQAASPRDFACRAAVNLYAVGCPGMPPLDVAKCKLTSEPQTTKRDAKTIEALGTGDWVNFGLPGGEWFMINRSELLANNDAALCGNLNTVGRFAKGPSGGKVACSGDEITKAERIDHEVSEAVFGVYGSARVRREAAGYKRAAKDLGISEKEARDLHAKVVMDCTSQLWRDDTPCTFHEIEVARALDAAYSKLGPVELVDMDAAEAQVRAENAATKRVAKRFGIGPAEATRASAKVSARCPEEL